MTRQSCQVRKVCSANSVGNWRSGCCSRTLFIASNTHTVTSVRHRCKHLRPGKAARLRARASRLRVGMLNKGWDAFAGMHSQEEHHVAKPSACKCSKLSPSKGPTGVQVCPATAVQADETDAQGAQQQGGAGCHFWPVQLWSATQAATSGQRSCAVRHRLPLLASAAVQCGTHSAHCHLQQLLEGLQLGGMVQLAAHCCHTGLPGGGDLLTGCPSGCTQSRDVCGLLRVQHQSGVAAQFAHVLQGLQAGEWGLHIWAPHLTAILRHAPMGGDLQIPCTCCNFHEQKYQQL